MEAASAPRETPSGSVPPAPADKRGAALIASILGLVIGTVCLLYGLAAFFGASVSLSSTSFGGDFYTYTYRGIVAIAQSQADQTKLLAMLCVGLGCFMDCHFLQQLRR